MKVVQIVPRISNESSGPAYSVPMLCSGLAKLGVDVELKTLQPLPGRELPFSVEAYQCWPTDIARRLGVSPDMKRALRMQNTGAHIIHNHSLWMMPNIYVGNLGGGCRAKLVMSPRGTLSDWSWNRARARKSLTWWLLGQRRACHGAALFHATSEAEYEDIRRRGFLQPVAIIPNGIEAPSIEKKQGASRHRTLLFLSRIHPTKQVEKLLHTWAQVQDLSPDWNLNIVGTGDKDYLIHLRKIASHLRLRRCHFVGELNGKEKWHAYAEADVFILPSASENFGMVVAEALSSGTPVITTMGTPWQGVGGKGCGWWIADDVNSMALAIGDAMNLNSGELREMGVKGRKWMEEDFSWATVCLTMRSVYNWLISGGAPPPAVVLK